MNVKKDNLIIVKYSGIFSKRKITFEKVILLIRSLVKFYGVENFFENYDIIHKHIFDKNKLFEYDLNEYTNTLFKDLGIIDNSKIKKILKSCKYYSEKGFDIEYKEKMITYEFHKLFTGFFFFVLKDVFIYMYHHKENYNYEILYFFKLPDKYFEYTSIINEYFPELLRFENISKYVSISLTGPKEYENFGAIDAFKVTINIFNDTQVT